MVGRLTRLTATDGRSEGWVMTRGQWLQANLQAFERILEPFARKVAALRPDGALSSVRRQILGVQVGGLLGYLGHRVLGQYDLFLPPDDAGLIYFVGPNIVSVERKFGFPRRDFRLWISLHEVTHRLQFGGVPWLRGHLSGLIDSYLSSVELDPRWLVESLRRAIQEVRSGRTEYRGFGWVFLLMTPDQRETIKRMQAVMSLLEGHGTYVMNTLAEDVIPRAGAFHRALHERRHRPGVERTFQKAIGFDVKVRQYDQGERFVAQVVKHVGMERFNRVWESPGCLPTIEEIGRPEAWVARVAA
jgi:coenzyme F420 biosynthesis associated uncharacterized protein